ncbi:MAG TPA: hypothetical protein VEC18_11375 [Myxococcota bacterium]|nr:hypothetical protein [Myxococcota bacterium]
MPESKRKRVKLGQMLVAAGAIDAAQLTEALAEQKRTGGLLGMAMLRLGLVDESTLVRVLASQLNLPVVQLRGKQISAEVLELVPVELVEKHRCLPLLINASGENRILYLGMEDPSDPEVVAEICTLVGMSVQAVLVAPSELDDGIFRHYQFKGFGPALAPESPPLAAKAGAPRGASRGLAPVAQILDPNVEDMQPAAGADVEAAAAADAAPRYVGVDELDSYDPDGPLEFIDSPALESARPAARAPGGASASTDAMLRAIAQLLVEKGVFSRDELVQQLQAMSKPRGG